MAVASRARKYVNDENGYISFIVCNLISIYSGVGGDLLSRQRTVIEADRAVGSVEHLVLGVVSDEEVRCAQGAVDGGGFAHLLAVDVQTNHVVLGVGTTPKANNIPLFVWKPTLKIEFSLLTLNAREISERTSVAKSIVEPPIA